MAADVNVGMNIINQVRGLNQLKSLEVGIGGLSEKIKKQAWNNRILNNTTDKMNKQIGKASGFYQKLSKSQVANLTTMEREQSYARQLGLSRMQLAMGLKRTGTVLGEDNKLHKDTGESIKDQSAAQANLVAQTKRFRMELLSVMFFGMAVARIFGAMTKGSLEAAGAMDVWGTLTMLVGLPGAEAIREAGFAALSIFDAMPPALQVATSYIAFLGQGLGTALMSVGMFGLGFEGLTKLFPAFGMAVEKAGGLFPWLGGVINTFASSTFGVVLGWIGAIGVGIVGLVDIFTGWGQNAAKVGKGVLFVLASIVGIIAIIAGAPALLVGGIVAAAAALISMLAKIKPIGEFFSNIGKGLMRLVGGVKGLFTGKGFFEGAFAETEGLARGGIVTRPTRALIGEAGPEAVIPLSGGVGAGMGGLVYSPTININANISSEVDINNLSRRLNDMLYTELRRLGVR